MFIFDNQIKQFCKFYSDDSTVRQMLAFETGCYVPKRRIARIRAKLDKQRVAHSGYLSATGVEVHENTQRNRKMMEQGSADLLRAITTYMVKYHPEVVQRSQVAAR